MANFRGTHPEAAFDLDSGIERYDRADINDYDMLIYPAGRKYQKYKGVFLRDDGHPPRGTGRLSGVVVRELDTGRREAVE